ncbi:ground-like domain protein [Ancylostoma ceylanicum]|uniref:Ground-like domain protein n=1 Tax=Ancylostoma ceylanicum TaxID=53326 RepID=A0A0D6LH39_9BILA|nr:ground-like domain protein [Ancylostoma ceylanicum]
MEKTQFPALTDVNCRERAGMSDSIPCPPCPDPAPPVQCQTDVQDVTASNVAAMSKIHFLHRISAEHRDRRALKNGEPTCNSAELRRIMRESIHENILMAKIAIVNRAAVEIGGHFDAVCATGKFSYFALARHDDISGQDLPKFASIPEQDDISEERIEADIPLEMPRISLRTITAKPVELSTTKEEDETTAEELAEMVTTESGNLDESPLEKANDENNDSDTLELRKRSRMIWPPREISIEEAKTQGLREETIMELEQQARKKKQPKENPELDKYSTMLSRQTALWTTLLVACFFAAQTSFDKLGNAILLHVQVLANVYDNEPVFRAFVGEVINHHLTKGLEPKLWKIDIRAHADINTVFTYLQEFWGYWKGFLENKGVKLSAEQKEAWDTLGNMFNEEAQAQLAKHGLPHV